MLRHKSSLFQNYLSDPQKKFVHLDDIPPFPFSLLKGSYVNVFLLKLTNLFPNLLFKFLHLVSLFFQKISFDLSILFPFTVLKPTSVSPIFQPSN